MNKLLIISALIVAAPGAALAQTTYYTDSYGRNAGSAYQSGNTTYYSDSYGRNAGSAYQSGNRTYYTDSYGRNAGSSGGY